MVHTSPKLIRLSWHSRCSDPSYDPNVHAQRPQCEALSEFAIAEDIHEILRQEQEHQIDLATALGENVPDLSGSQRPAR
jgi:hypothetical protein